MASILAFLKNDTVQKVYRTFIQAAAAQLALSGPVYPNTSTLQKAAIAGGAAALAYLWNGVIVVWINKVQAGKAAKFEAAVVEAARVIVSQQAEANVAQPKTLVAPVVPFTQQSPAPQNTPQQPPA